MAWALRCPDCRKAFKWDLDQDDPDECPLCGAQMATDKSDGGKIITMPNFLSAKTKQNDALQRQTVDASEQRMYKAAEMAGCDVSDMKDLKITNLRSTKHEGDVAAVPVVNDVSQHMAAMEQRGMPVGFNGGMQAQEYAAAAHQGPDARAGARAAESTQKFLHGMR